jgi:hypothetical protein
MATYRILHFVRRAANCLLARSGRRNSIGASILASFGMFGLAANGTCLAALAAAVPKVSKSGLAVER